MRKNLNKILASFLAGVTTLSNLSMPVLALDKIENNMPIEYTEAETDAEVVFHVEKSVVTLSDKANVKMPFYIKIKAGNYNTGNSSVEDYPVVVYLDKDEIEMTADDDNNKKITANVAKRNSSYNDTIKWYTYGTDISEGAGKSVSYLNLKKSTAKENPISFDDYTEENASFFGDYTSFSDVRADYINYKNSGNREEVANFTNKVSELALQYHDTVNNGNDHFGIAKLENTKNFSAGHYVGHVSFVLKKIEQIKSSVDALYHNEEGDAFCTDLTNHCRFSSGQTFDVLGFDYLNSIINGYTYYKGKPAYKVRSTDGDIVYVDASWATPVIED